MSHRYHSHQPQLHHHQQDNNALRHQLAGSPPAMHRSPHEPMSSSTSSFGLRHMPPPSSPQQYPPNPNGHAPISRSIPPATSPSQPFSTSRDLPALSSLHRPGSSMSISSMLGADPHRPSRESAPPSSSHFPPPPSTAPVPSPTYEPMRTPVSPRSSTGLTHLGYSPYKRPLTPDRFPPPVRQGPRGHRANSAGSTATTIFGSPDRSRHPTMRTPQPEPYQSLSRPLEVAHNSGRFGQGPYDARPTEGSPSATHQPSSNDARYAPHPGHYIAFGRSPNDAQATAPSPIGPLGRERVHNGMEGHPPHENGSSYQAQMDLQDGARPMHEHSQILRYEPDASDPRAAFKPALDHNPDGSLTVDKHRSMGSSQTSGDAFHHNGNLHRPNPFNANTEYSASLDLQPNPRQGPTLLNGTTPDAYTRPPVDDSSLQNRQPTPPPRGHLHVGADALGRRNGRISPLPQAVQGAQSQLSGPGGEPGIKSEFGRMFSGIGSGVGSAKSAGGSMGSGTPGHDRGQGGKESTPKKDGGEGLAFPAAASGNAADEVDATGHRAPSRVGGRKGKKVKAEEARVDSESGDGRATPGNAATRPLKKGKHGHHHHHHAHHHHHHHHNKPDDLGLSPPPPTHAAGTMSQQGDNMRSSTPQKATAASTHHHHHHHHRHGHQHRTATPTGVAKTPTTPTPIITRQPTTTILTQPLLNSIAHLPRHHLGSALYSSVVRPSTATKLWSSSDHLGFATTPLPLPRFEGKENCTFTVRIPSFLLLPHVREEVVRRRAVWGSEVYTDDSDVLGAAIHAGFVRGDWGEGVDGRELLELSMPAEAKKQSNGEPSTSAVEHLGSTTTTAVPSTKSSPKLPPRPAPHHALHVTILVLPALQTYASTTSFGLRSRTWDETHDGMSFTILKVDWVDERLGDVLKKKRGLGSRGDIGFRGAEGKRKRLKVFQDTGRLKVDAVRLKAGGFSEKIGTGQEKGMRGRMWSLGVVH